MNISDNKWPSQNSTQYIMSWKAGFQHANWIPHGELPLAAGGTPQGLPGSTQRVPLKRNLGAKKMLWATRRYFCVPMLIHKVELPLDTLVFKIHDFPTLNPPSPHLIGCHRVWVGMVDGSPQTKHAHSVPTVCILEMERKNQKIFRQI